MPDTPTTETDDATGASRPSTHRVLFVAVVVAWLLFDQLTKSWAESSLTTRDIDVVGSLRFNLAYNTGTAFSLGGGLGPWIAVVALAVVGVLVWQGRTVRTRLGAVALALIVGGALGNIIDRAFRGEDGFMQGAVVDFIDLQWWPIFNVADIGIVVGGILLVISSFSGSRRRRRRHRAARGRRRTCRRRCRRVLGRRGIVRMAIEETVPAALDGERLDRVVAMMTGASRTEVVGWVTEGLVVRNASVAHTRSVRVAEGDLITVNADLAGEAAAPEADPSIAFEVVYDDEDLIVVDKPPGLVVHPGAGHVGGTLVNGLLARYPEIAEVGAPGRPGIVHRLDKDTSGLMVVARSARAYEVLTAMLAERRVERRYLTLVWGHPESPTGLIDAPIGRSPREPTKMAVSAKGKEARTRYEVRGPFRRPRRGGPARVPPRDRPHPPDQGAPVGHRSPGRRRRPLSGSPRRPARSTNGAPLGPPGAGAPDPSRRRVGLRVAASRRSRRAGRSAALTTARGQEPVPAQGGVTVGVRADSAGHGATPWAIRTMSARVAASR